MVGDTSKFQHRSICSVKTTVKVGVLAHRTSNVMCSCKQGIKKTVLKMYFIHLKMVEMVR